MYWILIYFYFLLSFLPYTVFNKLHHEHQETCHPVQYCDSLKKKLFGTLIV